MNILFFYPWLPYPLDLAMAESGEGFEYKKVFESFCRRVEVVPFTRSP